VGNKCFNGILKHDQGCQMVNFQTQNPDLGKFYKVLQRKMLVHFVAIRSIFPPFWYILRPFDIFCGHLAYFPRFGMLRLEKSGNPEISEESGERNLVISDVA
jgi:hypothetical protein